MATSAVSEEVAMRDYRNLDVVERLGMWRTSDQYPPFVVTERQTLEDAAALITVLRTMLAEMLVARPPLEADNQLVLQLVPMNTLLEECQSCHVPTGEPCRTCCPVGGTYPLDAEGEEP